MHVAAVVPEAVAVAMPVAVLGAILMQTVAAAVVASFRMDRDMRFLR